MPINHSLLPNLAPNSYRITSPATAEYNCIAWAVGISNEWWDPAEGYPWPSELPRDVSVDTLTRLLEREGFVVCDNAKPEAGIEKIVIYGAFGEWEHVARQLDNGKWTSKMGPDEDIEHSSPDELAGGVFGQVVRLMMRPFSSNFRQAGTPVSPAVPSVPPPEESDQ
jgi:hypothetical protein